MKNFENAKLLSFDGTMKQSTFIKRTLLQYTSMVILGVIALVLYMKFAVKYASQESLGDDFFLFYSVSGILLLFSLLAISTVHVSHVIRRLRDTSDNNLLFGDLKNIVLFVLFFIPHTAIPVTIILGFLPENGKKTEG